MATHPLTGAEIDEPSPFEAFEAALERALGDWVRESENHASDLWGALANTNWFHSSGAAAGYTFRAADDVVQEILARHPPRSWRVSNLYCSAPAGDVSAHVAAALAAEGWISRPVEI